MSVMPGVLCGALSSVRQLADDNGDVILARDYSPYGRQVAEDGTVAQHSGYGYTGEQSDAGYTQFIFLRARWLDPESGRFLSQDTWTGSIQRPQTLHKYTYALNNPVLLRDPAGDQPYVILPNYDDLLGRIAVSYYRDQYLAEMVQYSQEFSIDTVELEAALYTMGRFEGFLSDIGYHGFGYRSVREI